MIRRMGNTVAHIFTFLVYTSEEPLFSDLLPNACGNYLIDDLNA